MKTDLNGLSKAYQGHLAAARPGPGAACPAPERLVRCVLGEMSGRERAEIVGHAADCAACSTALKEILALSAETDRSAAELHAFAAGRKTDGARAGVASWARPVLKPAVAALAGVLVMAVLIVSIPRLLDRSGTRGGAEKGIFLISPLKAGVTRDGLEFKWQGLAGRDGYTVEVFDSSLKLVWRSGRVSGTEIRLPDEASRQIVPGAPHYWMVTASADGRPDIQSKLAEFSVR